jgi:DNA ligase-associated metallophosphoesterase
MGGVGIVSPRAPVPHRDGSRLDHTIEIAGSRFVLLPERAALWADAPGGPTLLVSDVHLGKCEALRAMGSPLPGGIVEADLARLECVIARTDASRVVIIGDLLHAPIGVTEWLVDRVGMWRDRAALRDVEIVVVPGNHDRTLHAVSDAWRLRVAPQTWHAGPLRFVHDPAHRIGPADQSGDGAATFAWSGHLHPAIRLAARGDTLRLPCFWLTPSVGVLPAFSRFTGGVAITPRDEDRVFAIADDRVFPVPTRPRPEA